VIALWGGIRSLTNPVGSLLLGLGRADLQLKWNLGMLVITPPMLFSGFYFFPKLGWCDEMTGMVYAMLILVALVYLPVWYFLVRPLCHAQLWEYVVATLKPFGVSIFAILPSYWVFTVIASKTTTAFLVCTAWSVLNYILLCFKFNREWVDSMKELLGGVRTPSS
jgi:PST family polysaccharide transporter/teichuronic acid exporter/lipopolysaccharide exporter